MIAEDTLRSLLEAAAEAYEPPAGGPARVVDAVAITAPGPRTRRRATPSPRRLSLVAAVAVVVLAGGLALNGSGSNDADRSSAQIDGGGSSGRLEATGAALDSDQYTGGGAGSQASAAGGVGGAGLADSAKVIKTGSLTVEVPARRFDDVVDQIGTLATGAGGYVSNSETTVGERRRAGTVTIRVPADRFQSVISEVRDLGTVRQSQLGGRDVTEEYTDLQARLRALDTTRTSLLDVLSKARAVPDILAVQDRLNSLQTEIEQLQGRQRLLDDQVGLATLAVRLVQPGQSREAASGERSSWDKAWDGFTGTWAAVLAKSGTAAAVVVLLVAGLAGLWGLSRWARRARARLLA